jgi:hypothetical protein
MWQIEAKPTWHLIWRGNQLVRTKKQCSKESSWFEEPRIRLGTKVQSNLRIHFASNQSKLVPRKLDPGPWIKVVPKTMVANFWASPHAPKSGKLGPSGCMLSPISSFVTWPCSHSCLNQCWGPFLETAPNAHWVSWPFLGLIIVILENQLPSLDI